MRTAIRLGLVLAACAAALLAAAQNPKTQAPPPPAPPAQAEERPEVPPPPFTEGIFPCSNCHKDMKVNRTRRELTEMHTDIVLTHDAKHLWCLDCHDADDRDYLHRASGQRISFDES
jgi:hypothetical protein